MRIEQTHIHTAAPGQLAVQASELGLPPGSWPQYLELVGDAEPTVFTRERQLWQTDGELAGYQYTSRDGLTLTVWND
jgi:hypothetical protein